MKLTAKPRIRTYPGVRCITTAADGYSEFSGFDVAEQDYMEGCLTGVEVAWEVLRERDPDVVLSAMNGASEAKADPGRRGAAISFLSAIAQVASAQGVEEHFVVAAQLDVLQASAIAQGVVGEVEDVIRLVVGQVDPQQAQTAVDDLSQPELAHQQVHGTDAAVANATAALADLILDIAGGEHWFGTAAQVALVQAFLNPPLATGQLLSYSGVHSKSFRDWGDERLALLIKPQKCRGFRVFYELLAARSGAFA